MTGISKSLDKNSPWAQRGVVPASFTTAVSLTGTATETNLLTEPSASGLLLKAGSLKVGDKITFKAWLTVTGSTNLKTLKVKLGSTVLASAAINTAAITHVCLETEILITATNAQVATMLGSGGGVSAAGTTVLHSNYVGVADLTADTYLSLTGTLATTTETITLVGSTVNITSGS